MYDWITRSGYQPVIIATKLDKIKRSQVQGQLKQIRGVLGMGGGDAVIPFSTETKQGRDEIYGILDAVLEENL
jgi:GTP-binding protein